MNSLALRIAILYLLIGLSLSQLEDTPETDEGGDVPPDEPSTVTMDGNPSTPTTGSGNASVSTTTTSDVTLNSNLTTTSNGSVENMTTTTTTTSSTTTTTTTPTPTSEPMVPEFDPPNYRYKVLKTYREDYITPSIFLLIGLIIIVVTITFHYYMDSKEKQRQITTGTRYKPDKRKKDNSSVKSPSSQERTQSGPKSVLKTQTPNSSPQ